MHHVMQIKRKLYTRGSSFETTIPKVLLVQCDLEKKHDVIFSFDEETKRWYVDIIPASSDKKREDR